MGGALMTWFKVDDKLHAHRKARKAGKAALGIWVAGSWCMDNDSDGFVPADILRAWGGTGTDAKRLVDAGLWVTDEHEGESGWRFHDWSQFQPSAAVMAAWRAAESEAGRRGNHKRWHADRGISDPDCDYCYQVPDRPPDQEPDRVDVGSSIGSASPVPVPDPVVSPNGETRGAAASAETPKAKARRATKRAADFRPSQAHIDIASERGVDLEYEWAKFCDWSDANGKTYKDWPAALRNWLRNARPTPAQVYGSKRDGDAAMFDRMMERAVERERQMGSLQ
jgi:hypothetical protein